MGIESLARENLRQIHKAWNTVGIGYREALATARDHGIAIVGSFILGMDDDTAESLDRLLEFAVRERLFAVLFNLLTPYPGTELYDTFRRQGRLSRPVWWNDAGYTYGSLVFEPRANARDLWHAFTFLAMNLPARREEAMRFGRALGAA